MAENLFTTFVRCENTEGCLTGCDPKVRMHELMVGVLLDIKNGESGAPIDLTDVEHVSAIGRCASGPVIDEESGVLRCNPTAEITVETAGATAVFSAE